MLSKEEYKRALENMHSQVDIETQWYSYDILKKLIDEHFEPKENTSEFKHFKLHSDSTLKNLTKVELIDYIKMLYHNWGVCDEQLKNCINKAKELSDSNDELRGQLYFCEHYKFEDLKPNMWVYDGIEKLICQIGLISKNAIHREYVDGTISDSPFEENRFFPVQCANYLGGI